MFPSESSAGQISVGQISIGQIEDFEIVHTRIGSGKTAQVARQTTGHDTTVQVAIGHNMTAQVETGHNSIAPKATDHLGSPLDQEGNLLLVADDRESSVLAQTGDVQTTDTN